MGERPYDLTLTRPHNKSIRDQVFRKTQNLDTMMFKLTMLLATMVGLCHAAQDGSNNLPEKGAPKESSPRPQAAASGISAGGSRPLTVQQSVQHHASHLPPTMHQQVQQHAQLLGQMGYTIALPGGRPQNGMPQGLHHILAQENAATQRRLWHIAEREAERRRREKENAV